MEKYEWAPKLHTRLLLPMVDDLLKETGVRLQEIDAFAFGQGPGSFTGIRIACSVIQALSFGHSKSVVPISTLRAQAQRAYQELGIKKVFSRLEAGMQEIYWGFFELEESQQVMKPVGAEKVGPLSQVAFPPGSWHPATALPRAQEIVLIAAYEYQQGYKVPPEQAFPTYLRNEVAKKPAG